MLKCAVTTPCWAILSQSIDIEKYLGKELTFSIRYKAPKDSKLQFAIRSRDNKNKVEHYFYAYTYGNEYEELEDMTYSCSMKMPQSRLNDNPTELVLYLNAAGHEAVIKEVKLEIGNRSTMLGYYSL